LKTPLYEISPGALSSLLATRSFVLADLYTFTLAGGGAVLRYTTADQDMGYSGVTWTHGGPLFDQNPNGGSRSTGHWKLGLDVDTWQCTIIPRPVDAYTGAAYPDAIGGTPWLAAARAGALDGAVVTVDRAYLPAWPSLPLSGPVAPTGVVNIFTGRVATVDLGRSMCVVSLNSHLELLDTAMPRRLFQPGCINTLFDGGCTLVAASFAVAGTVSADTSSNVLLSSVSPPGSSSGTFALGRVVIGSGLNAGFSRSVRSWSAGTFTLLSPFPFPVAAGATLTAYPGCDKTLATCNAFGNAANFGGTPYVPIPETAV
jgi:hypothetical protein